jgi:hypothetical protein
LLKNLLVHLSASSGKVSIRQADHRKETHRERERERERERRGKE